MNTFKKKSLYAALIAGLAAISCAGADAQFIEAAPSRKDSLIPPDGIIMADFKEAKTSEIYALIQLVSGALKAVIYPGSIENRYVNVEAMYPDVAIVRAADGRYMAYPYQVSDNNAVTLGTPTEVVEQYAPVAMRESAPFVEAVEGATDKFIIRVIQSGLSLNRAYYPDAALKEAVSLFNGARVFVKSDAEHLAGGGKDVRNIIGRLSGAKFIEGATPDTGEIQATLTLLDSTDALATKLREAVSNGMTDLFGFSIDLIGKTIKRMVESKPVRWLTKATKVNSVDLIVEPGAGGALVRMCEAADPDLFKTEKPDMLRALMLKKIKAKLSADRIALLGNLDTCSDERLTEAYDEATALESGAANAPPAGVTQEQLREAVAVVAARNYVGTALVASALPAASRERLLESFNGRTAFTNADVDAAIKSEGEYIAKITKTGRVSMPGFESEIRISESAFEKVDDMLDAFFDPAHKQHRDVHSFKECYVAITGDSRVTGRVDNCDKGRMAEALGVMREALDSTSFSNVLGNSITRRMLQDYGMASEYSGWEKIASIVPVSDFRTQERTRFGGYGDLNTVAENDPYPELASPTDERATYGAAKRGGIERLSMEMIKNDDVGAIRRLPIKMSRAAKRTLAKFVFDFLRTNPLAYDGLAWFHASHANLFTGALSSAELSIHRLAMLKQSELNSADRIGVAPSRLLVPFDLQETAINLFNRNTNLDKTFVNTLNMEVIPVWYWTDVTDWVTMADPADIVGIEIGFLDGRQEPELFVADIPQTGALFTNDQISYKIRHIYGGNIMDFRAGTKAVVAG